MRGLRRIVARVSQIGFNHRSKFQRQGVESKLEAKLDVKLQATLGSTDNFHAVAMAALGFGNDASAACDTKNNDVTGFVMTRTKAMAAAANRLGVLSTTVCRSAETSISKC